MYHISRRAAIYFSSKMMSAGVVSCLIHTQKISVDLILINAPVNNEITFLQYFTAPAQICY